MFVAKGAEQRDETRRRDVDAAANLNRLHQNGADALPTKESNERGAQFFERFGPPRERSESAEFGELREKRRPEMPTVRRIQRPIANTMIRAVEGDDMGFTRREDRCFERRFHRLEAGVGEDGFAGETICRKGFVPRLTPRMVAGPSFEGNSTELTGQLRFERVRMNVAHRMQQLCHLPRSRLDDPRIRMSRGRYSEGGGQIQVTLAFCIPDMHPARAFPNNRPGAIRLYR